VLLVRLLLAALLVLAALTGLLLLLAGLLLATTLLLLARLLLPAALLLLALLARLLFVTHRIPSLVGLLHTPATGGTHASFLIPPRLNFRIRAIARLTRHIRT